MYGVLRPRVGQPRLEPRLQGRASGRDVLALQVPLPGSDGVRIRAELQQQLEFLQRGARATEAERELQAKKTPAAQLPRGQLLDHSLPPSAPAFDLMLSWGLDTPAASERSGVGGGGRDAAGELSDEGEGGEDFELIVMTPPLGSPLNTDRSQDDEPTDRRDIRQLL